MSFYLKEKNMIVELKVIIFAKVFRYITTVLKKMGNKIKTKKCQSAKIFLFIALKKKIVITEHNCIFMNETLSFHITKLFSI